MTREKWNRHKISVDSIFANHIARLIYIMNHNEDHKLKSVKEYRHRDDWPK